MKRPMILASVSLLVVLSTAYVDAADGALQGAWTMTTTSCDQTFEKVDGQFRFRNRGSPINTGLIIRGDTMMGPMSTCEIGGMTEHQGLFKVRLGCSSSIMFSEVVVTLKMVDNEHFRRIDPDFPEISREYERCG